MDKYEDTTLKLLAFHAVISPHSKTGFSLMHAACINGDLETLSIVLNCSPSYLDTCIAISISTTSDRGSLTLEDLVKQCQDSLKQQKMLLMLKKVSMKDKSQSLIHMGAKQGNVHHMKMLIKLGERVNSLSKDHMDKAASPLILASANNNAAIVDYLLACGANPHITDSQLNMAIHVAAANGNANVLSLLIDKGSDVNAKGFRGKQPLHFALLNGSTEAARLLCESGADITARTAFGDTPLICAAKHSNIENIKLVLNKGASVHERNSIGYSALFYAAKNGYMDVAKHLLDNGCDINARSRLRETPLIIASGVCGNKAMVEFLLRSGADINLGDRQGRQALHHGGDRDIVEALLLNGRAAIESRDLYGLTPLLYVCSSENPHSNMDVARKLIEMGACVNAQEVLSLYSPLHHLCTCHEIDMDIVTMLLDRGASVNTLDSEGESPLFSAVRNSDVPLIKLLLQYGASVNIQNESHLTPLDVCTFSASGSGDEETVVNILREHKCQI